MKQKPLRAKLGILAVMAGAALAGVVFVFALIASAGAFAPPLKAFAFSGPSQAPPGGYGAIGSDGSNNVSVGTSTTIAGTKLLVVGATNDNTSNALQVLENNKTPIFILRDDGSVSIETSTVSAGNTIIGGNLTVGGTFTASTLTGTITAGNISSGQFGSNTGGGNYYFPGNVGIGTTTPVTNLAVAGNQFLSGGLGVGILNSTGGTLQTSGNATIGGGTLNLNGTSNIYFNGSGFGAYINSDGYGIYNYLRQTTKTYSIGINGSSQSITFVPTDTSTWTTTYKNSSNAAAQLNFVNGGINYMSVNSSGNVGVGTTTPAYLLDVNGAASFEGNQIHNVGTPTAATDAANKSYVDSIVASGTTGSVSGTTNYVPVFTGTNTVGNSVVYQSGSNVGIGTTNPGYPLDVNGNARFAGVSEIFQQDTGRYGSTGYRIQSIGTNSEGLLTLMPSGTSTASEIRFYNSSDPNNTGALSINVAGNTANFTSVAWGTGTGIANLYLSPNVGIGTTTPAYKLDVNGAGSFEGYVIHNIGTPATGSDAANKSYVDTAVLAGVNGGVSGTTNYVPVFTGANTLGNSVVYQSGGNIGIGTTSPGARLDVWKNGSADVFNLSSSTAGDILTVLPSGNVGIGTTSPSGLLSVGNNNQFTVTSGGAVSAVSYTINGSTYGSQGNSWMGGNYISGAKGVVIGATGLDTSSTNSSLIAIGPYASAPGSSLYPAFQAVTQTNPIFQILDATGGNTASLQVGSGLFAQGSGNVGIGTTTPAYKLDVNGAGSFEGYVIHNIGTPATGSDAANKSYVDTAVLAGVNGGVSGTTNYIPLFTGTNTLGNSVVYQSGGNVGIGTTTPVSPLQVNTILPTPHQAGISVIGSSGTASPAIQSALYINGSFTPVNGLIGLNIQPSILSNTAYNFYGGYIKNTVPAGVTVSGNLVSLYLDTPAISGTVSGSEYGIYQADSGSMNYFSGNVGIGTTTPAYPLDVNGAGSFENNVIHNVGTPATGSDAANKSYVDTVLGGGGSNGNFATLTVTGTSTLSGSWSITGLAQAALNLNGNNITGVSSLGATTLNATTLNVNKINATTIDPVYQIGATKYATFAPSMIGVNEEAAGEGTLAKAGSDYEYAINFSKLVQGSDLWVWYQAVDFSKDSVNAIATPYGQFAEIYYTINGSTLTFHGNAPVQFSFNLTGKRFDWQKWPTQIVDQSAPAGFVLPVKN